MNVRTERISTTRNGASVPVRRAPIGRRTRGPATKPLVHRAVWLAFAICIFLEVYSFLSVTDYYAVVAMRDDRTNRIYQGAGLLILGVVAGLANYRRALAAIRNPSVLTIAFVVFSAYCLSSAIWSLTPLMSMLYALLNVATLVILKLAFQWDRYGTAPSGGAFALVLFFLIIIPLLGINGRFIGGNLPNDIGGAAFAGVVFAQFMKNRRLSRIFTVGFIALLAILSSRTYLLNSLMFLGLLGLLVSFRNRGTVVRAYMWVLAIALIFALVLVVGLTDDTSFVARTLNQIFAPEDSERGFESGLTGRTDMWARGIHLIAQSPWIGFGYRTRTSIYASNYETLSAHSGYLNLVLDIGIIGLLLFVGIVLISLTRRLKIYRMQKRAGAVRYDNLIYLAYFPSMILTLATEPTHLYIGLPSQMLNFMCLFVFRPFRLPRPGERGAA